MHRCPRRVLRALLLALHLGVAAVLLPPSPAVARSLDKLIPNLFGGTLATTIDPTAQQDQQRVLVADRFRGLSAALAAARSQAPIPSASGAFRFAWDPDLDTFVRYRQDLGSTLAERAQTLGRHTFTLGFSYTRIDFNTLEGDQLSHLHTVQPAFSQQFLNQLPPTDRAEFSDDLLQTRLNLSFGFDLFYLSAAYGVTDDIDVSLALSINRARMHASAEAMTIDPDGDGAALFASDQKGVVTDGSICGPNRCAVDGFDASAFGTGDLFLRGKWHFADTEWADFATVAVLTLPTGNASDYLGFHDPTFTPWLVLSKTFGRISPHLNLGYALRSSKDVSQAQWIAGADVQTTEWLTLSGDFLGYHDDHRDGINDNVIQSGVGFKIHPFGNFVFGGNLQFPVNRDGLRANVTYTAQFEYTF
jgi:hypothetical protein